MAFWLEVKKEYIIEDFEKALSYLINYEYAEDSDNSAFDKTLEALGEVVADICKWADGSSLTTEADKGGLSDDDMLRMVAAYLLTLDKMGRKDVSIFIILLNILFLLDIPKLKDIIDKLQALAIKCFRGEEILKYGFSWTDISSNGDFSKEVLCSKIAYTEFSNNASSVEIPYYEDKGLMIFDGGKLRLAPMNLDEYVNDRSRLQSQLALSDGTEIIVKQGDKVGLSRFDDLNKINQSLKALQSGVTPSKKSRVKTYDRENTAEDVLVKITSLGTSIIAETVDPDYETIRGAILFNTDAYSLSKFAPTYLQEGDFIKVRLQESSTVPFVFEDAFNEFYESYAKKFENYSAPAIYLRNFRMGSQWLTENGLIVNLFDNAIRDEDRERLEDAIGTGTPAWVKINMVVKDNHDHIVINGFLDTEEEEDVSREGFIDNAYINLIEEFVEWSNKDSATFRKRYTIKVTDSSLAKIFYRIFFSKAGNCYADITERAKWLLCARMAAMLCKEDLDAAFIQNEIRFLTEVVKFAQGTDPSSLNFPHDKIFFSNEEISEKVGIPKVAPREKTILQLEQFPKGNSGDSVKNEWASKGENEQIRDLVSAANTIACTDIVNKESIIDEIRLIISKELGAGSMFETKDDTSTDYGEESYRLEFKSSIVFTPASKDNPGIHADPAIQKWAILKSVCGFLNSMSGGEILLGVNDNGHANGLQDDLDQLYARQLIKKPNIDQLTQYVMNEINNAFCDYSGLVLESKDITMNNVECRPEKDNRGHDILRISVKPYENDVVKFKDTESLPEGYGIAYVRSSTSSKLLTPQSIQALQSSKKVRWEDANKTKVDIINKAKKEMKNVILKDYLSKNRKRDRNVEAYKYFPANNAIIAYDIDAQGIREFKLSRATRIEISDIHWSHHISKYDRLHIDIFDMMETPENKGLHIVLKLGSKPYNLMIEEHPGSGRCIRENKETDSTEYPFILDTTVYDIHGIGRFYVGLAPFIKIVEGEALKAYAKHIKETL